MRAFPASKRALAEVLGCTRKSGSGFELIIKVEKQVKQN
jgi:hypothetical protein